MIFLSYSIKHKPTSKEATGSGRSAPLTTFRPLPHRVTGSKGAGSELPRPLSVTCRCGPGPQTGAHTHTETAADPRTRRQTHAQQPASPGASPTLQPKPSLLDTPPTHTCLVCGRCTRTHTHAPKLCTSCRLGRRSLRMSLPVCPHGPPPPGTWRSPAVGWAVTQPWGVRSAPTSGVWMSLTATPGASRLPAFQTADCTGDSTHLASLGSQTTRPSHRR